MLKCRNDGKLTSFLRYWRMLLSVVTPPVLYLTVLHLSLPIAFLNFPLWSCPALWHAHWRLRGSQSPEGQEDPRAWQLLLIRCLLTVPTASTLQRMRFNFPPYLCPLQCAQRQPQKVRPCSTTSESCEQTICGVLSEFLSLFLFISARLFLQQVRLSKRQTHESAP